MFMVISMKVKICLILVVIHEIQSSFILPKKVIRKMKDEFKENIISEFVGLNSKVYSLIVRDGEEIKKAKGVNKNVVKNERQKEFQFETEFNKKLMT